MLWEIRGRMKPALQVTDLIPNVHRTPVVSARGRAVLTAFPAICRHVFCPTPSVFGAK